MTPRRPTRITAQRRAARAPFILVGFNDTPAATAALDWAGAAAARLGAELEVIWVQPAAAAWELAAFQVNPGKRQRQMLRRLRQVCAERLDPLGITYGTHVVEASPTNALRREGSAPGALLLVVGASHRGAIGDLVMGSVAHDLAHDAPVPVVVVPVHWSPESSEGSRPTARDAAASPTPAALG